VSRFKLFILFVFACSVSFLKAVDLNFYEKSLYSANGEDGILAKILQTIAPVPHFCVEIGAGDGERGSNTYLLRLQNWNALLLDRLYGAPKHHLHQEFVTAENINSLFDKYKAPLEFGLLSIGIDYNDFYLWKALDEKYRPAIVLIEYNGKHSPDEDKIVKYRPFFVGDATDYYGASLLALWNLGRSKGYSLVYAEQSGTHLFFIRDDLIQDKELMFNDINDPIKLHRYPAEPRRPDPKNRPYFESFSAPFQKFLKRSTSTA